MCAFEVLYDAYLEARKRKRKKAGTAQYEANVLACTEKLSNILSTKKYKPSKFEVFPVFEPKKRLVQAPAFVDKVVLHAVTDNVLYDALTKSFIRNNHASQKQKGMHDGLDRLKWAMIDYYRKNGTTEGWVLKCDVHHFFASIDHDLLKKKLWAVMEKRGVDPQFFELMCTYIDTTDGLPLGYQTSQLLALSYLDKFDHLIKEEFGFRYYGRYMDDFYIIARTKKELQDLLHDVNEWMGENLLELNNKTGIFPLRNGIDFMGFHTYLTETGGVVQKLRKSGIDRMKARVKKWEVDYPAGKVTKEQIKDSFRAWDAHAAHGDTHALRAKFAAQVSEIIGEEVKPRRKITAPTNRVREIRKIRQYQRLYKKTHPAAETPKPSMNPRPDDALPWE